MNQVDQDVEGVELPELEEEGGAPSPPPMGGGKKMNPILFGGIIVLILGFQAVSSYWILGQVMAKNPYFPGSPPDPEAGLYGMLYTLEGIIVNPTDSNGSRVLLVDIGFETGSENVVLELQTLEPQLRDNINTFLSAQRLPVLSDISLRDRIRDRVKAIANHHLTTGKVGRVFFIRYVLQ